MISRVHALSDKAQSPHETASDYSAKYIPRQDERLSIPQRYFIDNIAELSVQHGVTRSWCRFSQVSKRSAGKVVSRLYRRSLKCDDVGHSSTRHVRGRNILALHSYGHTILASCSLTLYVDAVTRVLLCIQQACIWLLLSRLRAVHFHRRRFSKPFSLASS